MSESYYAYYESKCFVWLKNHLNVNGKLIDVPLHQTFDEFCDCKYRKKLRFKEEG